MKLKELKVKIKIGYEESKSKIDFHNEIVEFLHDLSGIKDPVDAVLWVPIEMVQANDYDPNTVANNELKLLYTSIEHDRYTQPIVTVFDEEEKKYIIIDGFHRYFVMKKYKDIRERTNGYLPIVVLSKDINDRMASTIRHNRARGKHSVGGMGEIVFKMLDNGWGDAEICKELGMEADELVRLKHVTGFSKLFEETEYKRSWETKKMIKGRIEWRKEHGDE